MPRARLLVLVGVALATAGICIRLGLWQLERLGERRAANGRTAARLDVDPVELGSITIDSGAGWRRVRLRGTYDFDREFVLPNRSRDGAPGVNLLTPLRVPGLDSAVLVNRGWIYAPDGASVDRVRWREGPEGSGIGYVLWPTPGPPVSAALSPVDSTRRLSRVDAARIAASIPYPVASYHVVLLADPAAPGEGATPVRLEAPPLDEGPHKSYAIQWFSFAAVVVIGTSALIRADQRRDGGGRVGGGGRAGGPERP